MTRRHITEDWGPQIKDDWRKWKETATEDSNYIQKLAKCLHIILTPMMPLVLQKIHSESCKIFMCYLLQSNKKHETHQLHFYINCKWTTNCMINFILTLSPCRLKTSAVINTVQNLSRLHNTDVFIYSSMSVIIHRTNQSRNAKYTPLSGPIEAPHQVRPTPTLALAEVRQLSVKNSLHHQMLPMPSP